MGKYLMMNFQVCSRLPRALVASTTIRRLQRSLQSTSRQIGAPTPLDEILSIKPIRESRTRTVSNHDKFVATEDDDANFASLTKYFGNHNPL